MNFNINDLPFSIRQKVDTQPYKCDTIGESEASVIIFNDMALKIEKTNESADREYNALKFLHKNFLFLKSSVLNSRTDTITF